MAPAKTKKKKGGKGKSKGKKDDKEDELIAIKLYEIKKVYNTYNRQCTHFVTVPMDQVSRRIEKYNNENYLFNNKGDFLDKVKIFEEN